MDNSLLLDPRFGERFERQRKPACQLYLVSPDGIDEAFAATLEQALSGGPVAAFQLRLKGRGDEDVLRVAAALLPVCRASGCAFILNDRMDMAQACGADGVHLGQSDGDPREARALLGPTAQIGRTCHDSRHLAMDAGEAGCDYVAFGAFYETTTKPSSYRPDPSILAWWDRLTGIPSVAIGGITPENGRILIDAGADFLAVCQGVWSRPEGPPAAVAAFNALFADTASGA